MTPVEKLRDCFKTFPDGPINSSELINHLCAAWNNIPGSDGGGMLENKVGRFKNLNKKKNVLSCEIERHGTSPRCSDRFPLRQVQEWAIDFNDLSASFNERFEELEERNVAEILATFKSFCDSGKFKKAGFWLGQRFHEICPVRNFGYDPPKECPLNNDLIQYMMRNLPEFANCIFGHEKQFEGGFSQCRDEGECESKFP